MKSENSDTIYATLVIFHVQYFSLQAVLKVILFVRISTKISTMN